MPIRVENGKVYIGGAQVIKANVTASNQRHPRHQHGADPDQLSRRGGEPRHAAAGLTHVYWTDRHDLRRELRMFNPLLDAVLDRTVVAGYTSTSYRIRRGM